MAAVLACGEGAALSHRSAAALWGIRRPSARIEVTSRRTAKGFEGVVLHRTRHLLPDHITRVSGIPVTTVARTLVDLADVLSRRELDRAIEQAERLRLFDLTAVEAVLAQIRRRPGSSAISAAVEEARAPEPTREELEARFRTLCRDHAIPPPAINAYIEGHEVDTSWPAAKLIVELDGWEFHRTRAAFERDRRRDAELQLAGWRVLRVSWRWLNADPSGVAHTVHALLQPAVEGHSEAAMHG